MSRRGRSILHILCLSALATSAVILAARPAMAQGEGAEPGPVAVIVEVDGVSFERLMSVPEVAAFARAGGAGLMVPQEPVLDVLERLPPGRFVSGFSPETSTEPATGRDILHVRVSRSEGPSELDLDRMRLFLRGVGRFGTLDVLVLIVGTRPSPAMADRDETVLPVVMANPSPRDPFTSSTRTPGSLTSDATRRDGVVSSLDLAPTVLEFLDRPVPDDVPGAAIRVIEGPPPFELYERYQAYRTMSVPIQLAADLYVLIGAAALVMLLWFRERLPSGLVRRAAWVGLSVAPLGVALLAAGHLPTLSYATVVPFVVAVTVLGTLAVVPLRRRGVLAPPAGIGWAVLAYFVVEASVGWTAALTPFLGGSQLDGGRFFGLPNVFEGLIAGAALYAVATRGLALGTAVLVGAALLMGLPQLGANIGGAITGFTAAGVWLALRTRGRLDLPGLGLAGLVAAGGTAAVLAVHRFLPGTPTHATRFVAGESGGLFDTFVDRLEIGLDLIALNPFALLPTVGVIVMLVVSLRPPSPVRAAFERFPRWRDVTLTLSIAAVVALVANDTGPAAAGLAFGLALGGLLYVTLICVSHRGEPGKMEGHEPAAAAVD